MVGSRRGCKLGVQGAAERAERLETTAVGAPPLLTGVLVIARPGSSGHGAGHCWPQDTALPWISPKCLSPASSTAGPISLTGSREASLPQGHADHCWPTRRMPALPPHQTQRSPASTAWWLSIDL